ncbi:hypothetical protein SeMB42_g05313 [Synchytrium endobioticum]|uniref:Fibronectin type-III domain-containing protein n=1 Tax=Synchytrium endobioticum TaxID=286115 RepID=A0A507CS85_9FUNG|nr:hypothetical protein SeMB42_g05313 [Synchytrium endobioticum]
MQTDPQQNSTSTGAATREDVSVIKATKSKEAGLPKIHNNSHHQNHQHPAPSPDAAAPFRAPGSPTTRNPAGCNNNVWSNSINPDTIASFLGQLERIRNALRDRDTECSKLRQEIGMLKQVERRQRKDIVNLESETEDAPRIINGLRHEIAGLKMKLKAYFLQHTADSRQLRLNSEDLSRLKSEKARLDSLVASEDLPTREELEKKLEDAVSKLADREDELTEMKKRVELLDKNMSNENRLLRGRVHALEIESVQLRDAVVQSEEVVKEKDKEIASLSIYRYNMLRKKSEGPCKVCSKRQRQEAESKRRQDILATLPTLSMPSAIVTSATSVKVTTTSSFACTSIPSGASLNVAYSTEPLNCVRPTILTAPLEYKEATNEWSVDVSDLAYGKVWYFGVYACKESVNGPIIQSEGVYVDAIPTKPQPPLTICRHTTPPSMLIRILTNNIYTGTPITTYRLYKSTNPTMQDSTLLTEISIDQTILFDSDVKMEEYDYVNCQLGVTYYFAVVAVNAFGESETSEPSVASVLDLPPCQPSQPVPKKASRSSINLYMSTLPTGGSPAHTFRIQVDGLNKNKQVDESRRRDILVTNVLNPARCSYVISGLDASKYYRFQVWAKNAVGWSPPSAASEPVKLDEMVPPVDPPSVQILSSRSAQVCVQPVDSVQLDGTRIYSALDADMDTETVACTIPAHECDATIESAQPGAMMWIRACYVAGQQEGEKSNPVFVPLAAAIPLPPSPPSTPAISEDHPLLPKSASRSINLHGSNVGLNSSDSTHVSLESIPHRSARRDKRTGHTKLSLPSDRERPTGSGSGLSGNGTVRKSNVNLKSSIGSLGLGSKK